MALILPSQSSDPSLAKFNRNEDPTDPILVISFTSGDIYLVGGLDFDETIRQELIFGASFTLSTGAVPPTNVALDMNFHVSAQVEITVTLNQAGTDPILHYFLEPGRPNRVIMFITHEITDITIDIFQGQPGAKVDVIGNLGPAILDTSGGGGSMTITNFRDLINLWIGNNNQSNNRPVGAKAQRVIGPNIIP